MENATIQKFKCDILSNFQTLRNGKWDIFCDFQTPCTILPLQKFLKGTSVSKSGSSNANIFLQSQVLHLMLDLFFVPISRLFGLIGFNASDVMGIAFHQRFDQFVGLRLDFGTCRHRSFFGTSLTARQLFPEQLTNEIGCGTLHQFNQIIIEDVTITVTESSDVVFDNTWWQNEKIAD